MKLRDRQAYSEWLRLQLGIFPAVAVLGARQVGKSTLIGLLLKSARGNGAFSTFDLERPSDLARLSTAPEDDLGLLQRRKGLIFIDEIQRAPQLFSVLRPLLDDPRRKAHYVLSGSASPTLVSGVSESLAGRIGFVDLTPFLSAELADPEVPTRNRLWLRGGFPRSFLARSDAASLAWRNDFIRTYLEQDIPALGLRLPAVMMRRLWTMAAHGHGTILNVAELSAGLGIAVPTVKRYLDILEGTFMLRRLTPYWRNVGKRLVKAPKLYLRDSGLLHALLGIDSISGLRSHPKVGASWEGWIIEQVTSGLKLARIPFEAFFWRTHGGAEVDLLLEVAGQLIPIEIKLGPAPERTRGLLECMKDLGLPKGYVIHSGPDRYPLGQGVEAVPARICSDLTALVDLFGPVRP